MKKTKRKTRTTLNTETWEAESLEKKIQKITENNEPISEGAPIIFTEKKDGVRPEFNIRTDKWEIAQSAMDMEQRNRIAKSKMTAEKDTTDTNTETPTEQKTE